MPRPKKAPSQAYYLSRIKEIEKQDEKFVREREVRGDSIISIVNEWDRISPPTGRVGAPPTAPIPRVTTGAVPRLGERVELHLFYKGSEGGERRIDAVLLDQNFPTLLNQWITDVDALFIEYMTLSKILAQMRGIYALSVAEKLQQVAELHRQSRDILQKLGAEWEEKEEMLRL